MECTGWRTCKRNVKKKKKHTMNNKKQKNRKTKSKRRKKGICTQQYRSAIKDNGNGK
jgi:hypothetical protein